MAHALPLLRGGHDVRLLQGSAEFFPALIEAVQAAAREVLLESYIFDLTGSGVEVAEALEAAARRGVRVAVLVDGFGSAPLPAPWQARFAQAGVQWRVYSPPGWLGLLLPGNWRRLHRKLCVVDGAVAFCGGINVLDDLHDPNHGPLTSPRFDFAVRITGPLAAHAHAAVAGLWLRVGRTQRLREQGLAGALDSLRGIAWRRPAAAAATGRGGSRAALVLRDNVLHRAQIEKAYRRAIGRARSEIIIANAYFVPGRKMREALVQAARRGVRVRLLLQGRYEYFMQYYAARPVYGRLLRAGVEIHEYSPSFLHAKVAVIDGRWATVGSSNLDPLSLLLAREANVVVDDAAFAAQLRAPLVAAMQGQPMAAAHYEGRPRTQRLLEWLALVLMRLALAVQGKKYL